MTLTLAPIWPVSSRYLRHLVQIFSLSYHIIDVPQACEVIYGSILRPLSIWEMGEQGQLDRFNLMSLTQDSLPPPPDFAQWSDLSYPQGTEEPSSDAHANLIYFLGACQALNVDLVPITWQPALADLGEGGQATIRQAHSLVDWSFAFRQFRPVDAEASDEARPQAYHALIREVSILKHPEIRENPCALTLEGVCWDVSREDEVWPVLIFEKSRHGNLREFLGSSTGRQANLEDIMSLWFDVATTIMYMHAASEALPDPCCPFVRLII